MHFSCIVITKDTTGLREVTTSGGFFNPKSYLTAESVEKAMYPYQEVWQEEDARTIAVYDDDGEVCFENPDAEWDWYQIGGRWFGLIEATEGEHGDHSWCNRDCPAEDGHYDSALVKDIIRIDPSRVHDVITPDGVWHHSEEFREDLANDEHPFGQFVKDPDFKERFKELFLDPYQDCRAFVVDYHD